MRLFVLTVASLSFLKVAYAHDHKAHGKVEEPAVLSGESIYNIESQWTNQTGQTVELSKLGGVVRVVALAYTSCQYACPLITADMKKIERILGDRARNNIRFTLFSIDPKRDTPKALSQYAKKKNLNSKNWDLLTSNVDSVRDLAAALGFKYKKTDDGEFNHSNIIFIIDQGGVVRYQQVGLSQDPKETLSNILKLIP